MAAIDFEQVTFSYPGAKIPALDNLDFVFPKGAFIGVIGANNAGKSTLCAVLAGIVPQMYHGQMDGAVRIEGQKISDKPTGELAGRVGMVLQIPGHQLSGVRFTVFEEAAFALENLGVNRQEMIDRVEKALELTGLSDLAQKSPHQLSGGQQQRLAIASVLAVDPEILVLDEPTAFLDPLGAAEIFRLLARLNRQGKTIVLAEQRLEWIAEYATWVVALSQGKKVLEGPPEKVLTSPAIEEIGLDRTRYTKAAELGRVRGIWPKSRPLPASFSKAAEGFGACLPPGLLPSRGESKPSRDLTITMKAPSSPVSSPLHGWERDRVRGINGAYPTIKSKCDSPENEPFPRKDTPATLFIQIESLSFTYPDGTTAIEKVSLEIAAGERVALVGRNGSGKSTLAKHLIGLLRPSSGKIRINGSDTENIGVAELASQTALLFQHPRRPDLQAHRPR